VDENRDAVARNTNVDLDPIHAEDARPLDPREAVLGFMQRASAVSYDHGRLRRFLHDAQR
jgi:hypothetical protein